MEGLPNLSKLIFRRTAALLGFKLKNQHFERALAVAKQVNVVFDGIEEVWWEPFAPNVSNVRVAILNRFGYPTVGIGL